MKSYFIKKLTAFTLAEVLITLGIIGIVAQMTIPTMSQKIEQQELGAQVKKFVSEFERAYKQIIINNDCDTVRCTGLYDEVTDPVAFEKKYTQELSKVFPQLEVCSVSTSCNFTWTPEKRIGGAGLWGSESPGNFKPIYRLRDGAIIEPRGSYLNTATASKVPWFANFYIDVNGVKKPNVYGKDIHWVHIGDNGQFIPDYGKDYCEAIYNMPYTTCPEYWQNNDSCNPDHSWSPGDGCMARIMENSWKFDFW